MVRPHTSRLANASTRSLRAHLRRTLTESRAARKLLSGLSRAPLLSPSRGDSVRQRSEASGPPALKPARALRKVGWFIELFRTQPARSTREYGYGLRDKNRASFRQGPFRR